MSAPKRGDAVLVRAVFDDELAPGWVWTDVDGSSVCVPTVDITTEAEIRRQAFRDAAAMLRGWAEHPSVGNRLMAQFLIGLADEVERLDEAREAPERSEGDG